MTPDHVKNIRAENGREKRRQMNLYRADLEKYKLGRMSGHFEALDFPRKNLVAPLVIAAAFLTAVIAIFLVGPIIEKAMTEAIAAQMEG